jgi:hypothetical protein
VTEFVDGVVNGCLWHTAVCVEASKPSRHSGREEYMETMGTHRKPTKVKHHSEQLEKILALLRTGANECTTVNSDSSGRYEAVLKHCSDGLLDRDFFDDPDIAKRWLFRRWAELCVPSSVINSHCVAAIYDQRDSRKRIFTMGASNLLNG